MPLQHAILLLTKKLSGEATASELEQLNHMLSQQPELHEQLAEYEKFWDAGSQLPHDAVEEEWMQNCLAGFGKPENETQDLSFPDTPRRRRLWPWLTAAAAAVLFAAFWFYEKPVTTLNQSEAGQSIVNNEVSTRPGSRTRLVLPDGTQAWLNAESKLTYAPDFNLKSRKVHLDGEAYFIVTKNRAKPFLIETSELSIKVTGTTFNVRAYATDKQSETSLVEGSVEVTVHKRPGEVYVLRPSEKLVLQAASADVRAVVTEESRLQQSAQPVVEKVAFNSAETLAPETAWVHNVLAFTDESFRNVADKMERWYNVRISFGQQELESIHFTGTFDNETVEQALDALQLTTPFAYRINRNEIIIIPK